MSTLLQTDADRSAEERARRFLQRQWQVTLLPRGDVAEVDWAAYTPGTSTLRGFAEFKRRRAGVSTYPTVYLCQRKYDALMALRLRYPVPVLYVVGWDDALGWIDVEDPAVTAAETIMGGRAVREGSAHDQEPLRLVPIMALHWVAGWPG